MHLIPRTCEELLAGMVGIDSVNTQLSGRADAEAALGEWLERVAGGMGFSTRRLDVAGSGAFNVLVIHETTPGAPWLVFDSHIDTVGVAAMIIDPFGAAVRDGRLYGRGACDTKSSGAAMLWALKESAPELRGNVAVVFTVDEEIVKRGVQSFVRHSLPVLGWTVAGAIIGEPTLLRPVVAHNGVVSWKIKTRGRAAHSSNPALGRSAISMMARVIDAIERDYIPHLSASDPLTGSAQCSINVIRGGTQYNVIPDHCEIVVDRRLVPGESREEVIAAIGRILERLGGSDPDFHAEQEILTSDIPLRNREGEPFEEFVADALRSLGLDAAPAGAPYSTNASTYAAAGIPAVVLGPGDIAQAHTADEWVALEQVERAVTMYGELMRRHCAD